MKAGKVVFCNHYGNGYGDNPKYIAEEMIRRGLDYDFVWMLKSELMDHNHLPRQIRPVRIGSLKSIYEMVTAAVWIDDVRQPSYIKKRRGQHYIQTFHGGPSLKRVEKDVEDKLSSEYVKNAISDSKKANLFLSNGSWFTNLVRNSFWYSGEILESGFPRNDIFSLRDSDVNRRVRAYFGISETNRIVLYAPTFRKDHSVDVYDLDIDKCLAALSEHFLVIGSSWFGFIQPFVINRFSLMVGLSA